MEISSFDSLPRQENTLYVLDIDETILTHERSYHSYSSHEEYEKSIAEEIPIPCDKEGLNRLYEDCLKNGSKIVYLTARYETIRKETEDELRKLFPWTCVEDIYMSNGWTKDVPMNIVLRDHKHERCIFVDDRDYNLTDIKKAFGDKIECYKFIM